MEAAVPRLSATVVVLRPAAAGPEVLLLERRRRVGSAGPWVFPGGQVEPHDERDGDDDATLLASAVRETREEVGLFNDPNEVHDGTAFAAVGHWTTPEEVPRRYDTRFFLARHPGGEARVADDELVEVWWERPADTLARLEAGELDAITPTIAFLTSLSRYRHVADAFAGTELGHEHVFAWGITTF